MKFRKKKSFSTEVIAISNDHLEDIRYSSRKLAQSIKVVKVDDRPIVIEAFSKKRPKRKNYELIKRINLREVEILDDKIVRLSSKRQEAEHLINESSDKESLGESVRKFLRSFFDAVTEDAELLAMRKEIRERIDFESIIIDDRYYDLVYAVHDFLSERESKYNQLKIKVKKDLSQVRVFFDIRHRIRHFIDKMYRYNNSDDEEGSSYKTHTSQRSFIMNNLINLFRHGIKNRNAGVFRLPPYDTKMGSRAA